MATANGARRLPGTGRRPSPYRRPHRPNAGAERVDIKALLGHESVATTQIDTNVGQERMEQVVARL